MEELDCRIPTPRLDEVAERMAELLSTSEPMTIREIADVLDVPRGTVDGILRRPCERHGLRFAEVSRTRRGGVPRTTRLFGLAGAVGGGGE